jgi:CheY-like chemotaxis protein/HPt (histidine-containing phosphotransfer) domain-containing protein
VDGNDDTGSGAPSGGRRRVLVADDSESYRRIARSQLTARGLEVVTVASGAEALDRLAAEPFDLVFLDGMMPGLDGAATAREIRRREDAGASEEPRIAIVALTGSALPEDRDRMLEAGMDDIVAKPIEPEDLDAALARWLSPATPPRGGVIAPVPVPAAPSAAPASLVDPDAVARLGELGDPSFVARLVRVFLADAEHRIGQVDAAIAADDAVGLSVALDALDSIASIVGASALGRQVRELRAAAGSAASMRAIAPSGLSSVLAASRGPLEALLVS